MSARYLQDTRTRGKNLTVDINQGQRVAPSVCVSSRKWDLLCNIPSFAAHFLLLSEKHFANNFLLKAPACIFLKCMANIFSFCALLWSLVAMSRDTAKHLREMISVWLLCCLFCSALGGYHWSVSAKWHFILSCLAFSEMMSMDRTCASLGLRGPPRQVFLLPVFCRRVLVQASYPDTVCSCTRRFHTILSTYHLNFET